MGEPMKKLYLFALEKERDAFLKGLNKAPRPGVDFFMDDDAAYAIIGVGKVFAAMRTEKWITAYQPGLIINVGVAGGLQLATDDWVLVEEVLFYDVDVTAFGYLKGQYPSSQASFKADLDSLTKLKKILSGQSYHLGTVATGDTFMTEPSRLHDFKNVQAVDMELGAIALVCAVHQLPWVSVKTISDTVGTDSQIQDFDHWVEEGLKKVAPLIERALT